MKIESSNPTTIDGVEFSNYLVNLSMSDSVKTGGIVSSSMAIRLTPMREVSGDIELKKEYCKSLSKLDVLSESKSSEELSQAIAKIKEGLEKIVELNNL
jgi:hypothetical protein